MIRMACKLRLDFTILAIILIFFQRIWINEQVPIIFLLFGLYTVFMYYQNKLKLELKSLLLFCALIVSCLFSTYYLCAIMGATVSFLSVAYFAIIYAVFSLMQKDFINIEQGLLIWNKLVLICAFFAILQMVLQLFGVTLELVSFLPKSMLACNVYNCFPLLHDSAGAFSQHSFLSTIHKANGLFFLEPSFLSQFMALAIVIEVLYLKSVVRTILFGLALILSFSGTGLLMLLFSGILYLILSNKNRIKQVGCLALLLIFFVMILGYTDYGSYVFWRVADLLNFKEQNSSAYIRFYAPFVAMYKVAINSFLFGNGAGLQNVSQLNMVISPNLTPIPQVFVYYGFFATVLYIAYILKATFINCRIDRNAFMLLSTVLFMNWFCSGALLTPNIVFILLWFIWLVQASSNPALIQNNSVGR